MAFCTKCGKQATGNERFCSNCGAELPGAAPQAQQGYPAQQGYQAQQSYPPQQADQYGYQPQKPKMDKKKLYILIGAGVAVVAAIVVLIIVLTGGGSKTINAANVEGTWEVTDISGGGVNADLSMVFSMGGSISMTFRNGTVTMNASIMGQSMSQELGKYEFKDGKLYINNVDTKCEIKGDTMTFSDSGATIKLKKK